MLLELAGVSLVCVCVRADQAFLAASMRSDEELIRWFRERLVWNDPATVTDLLKNGLFVRLYEPQARTPVNNCICCTALRFAPG